MKIKSGYTVPKSHNQIVGRKRRMKRKKLGIVGKVLKILIKYKFDTVILVKGRVSLLLCTVLGMTFYSWFKTSSRRQKYTKQQQSHWAWGLFNCVTTKDNLRLEWTSVCSQGLQIKWVRKGNVVCTNGPAQLHCQGPYTSRWQMPVTKWGVNQVPCESREAIRDTVIASFMKTKGSGTRAHCTL